MVVHWLAKLETNLSLGWDLWHMHHEWSIEYLEDKYVDKHTRVAHPRFQRIHFVHCHQVEHVATWAEVAPVVVEVYLIICTSSMSMDTCFAIFTRKAAIHLIFTNYFKLSLHCSLHGLMGRKLHTPAYVISDWGMMFLDSLSHFLYCSMRKPPFGHNGYIHSKAPVGLF